VGIAGIDTRRLTRILRRSGAQNACLWALPIGEGVCEAHWDEALAAAQSASSMAGLDLAKVVSRRDEMQWNEGEWSLGQGFAQPDERQLHVVAYDFGVKRNILRMLASRGCRVTVVPAQTPAAVACSSCSPTASSSRNGPGDPEPCDYAIAATRELICVAAADIRHLPGPPDPGAGQRRPHLQDEVRPPWRQPPGQGPGQRPRGITSQNHGFAVDETTLPANVRATHISLFDGTFKAWRDRPAGLQLPGASGGQPRAARHRLRCSTASFRADGEPEKMPKRTDMKSILIIGAGPIVIGQACEFDYSGAQACKALREEGYRVILVNSNPATIMTDPEMADVTYIEPITWQVVEKIIAKERRPPTRLLPTMGGQTALNCALDLHRHGVLAKYGVEMIGANERAIEKAEDRMKFKDAMTHRPGFGQERHRAQHGRGAGGAEAHPGR
jgi:hypothetical protein